MKLAIVAFVFMGACFAQLPVTGRIVDDIDGQPVANARVKLLNDAVEVPIVRTDGDGRFVFSVPEGTYKLAVEKAEFLPYPNEALDVKEGSPGNLILVLTKTRSITARLVWADGEPLTRVQVRMAWLNGKRLDVKEGQTQSSTDQLYFSNLQPGRYVLSIDPAFGINGGRTGVATEFPSPEAVERGEVIDLRFTATRDLGNITVTEAAGVEVSGRFDVTEKIPMTNPLDESQKGQPSIHLLRPDGSIIARALGQADGTFRFSKVAPGTYYLVGNTLNPSSVTFGVQEIRVGATSLSGLVMALRDEPPVITGRFETETPEGRVGVGAQALLRFMPQWSVNDPRPSADGNFSIKVPMSSGGPISGLRFSMRGSIPPDTYIASFTQGNATYTRDPFPVAVNGEPVHVLFKQDGATIRGQVPISGNLPYPPFIVLAPKEREAEFFYRTASTDSKGSFQLQAIAPGTYDLFAFDREANYAGDQTLRAYQEAAISVTVAAGKSLTVNPNVVRIEK